MYDIVSDIICKQFISSVGKGQSSKETPMALQVSFRTRVDHDKEDGYRDLDIVLYAKMNYVQVWTRTRWNVIPNEAFEYDAYGEPYIKEGFDYDKGASEWEKVIDHDSCWRDAVRDILRDNRGDILGLNGAGDWCTVVPAADTGIPLDTYSI
jgi:hypothetical protein